MSLSKIYTVVNIFSFSETEFLCIFPGCPGTACRPGWPKLTELRLPLPPECWDGRRGPPHLAHLPMVSNVRTLGPTRVPSLVSPSGLPCAVRGHIHICDSRPAGPPSCAHRSTSLWTTWIPASSAHPRASSASLLGHLQAPLGLC